MIVPFVDIGRLFNQSNTTGLASGTGTAYPSETLEFTSALSGVRFARSFVFCVLLDRCLSVCPFSFGHCVVCLSSISGFLYYLVGISKLFLMTIPGSTSIHKIDINHGCHQLGSFYSIFSYLRRSLFVLFPLAIVLSALLQLPDSDYPFGIFKLFVQ